MSNTKKKYLVGGIILAIALGFLFYNLMSDSLTYYYTVAELVANGAVKYVEDIRVSGSIVEGSIEWDPKNLELQFEISDGTGNLPAIYQGAIPDGFVENKGVLLEGQYNSDGVFQADDILMKCSSKYEAQD